MAAPPISPDDFWLRLLTGAGIWLMIMGFEAGKEARKRIEENEELEREGSTLPYLGVVSGFVVGSVPCYYAFTKLGGVGLTSFAVYYAKATGHYAFAIILFVAFLCTVGLVLFLLIELVKGGYSGMVSAKRDVTALIRTYL